ncbi:hypothetical protein [Paenibacillus sp. MBLB4367]|uniref:hypothetical protein n=1 Tax=Paenibacillus sp. MBLB4367 TaxID=3384767 RepID=UPI00390830F0
MSAFKKRLQKKYFSRVAAGLANGKLSPFYARRALKCIQRFFFIKYVTEFQPWWWDQFDNWGKLDLTTEHRRYVEEWNAEIERISGIDQKQFDSYLDQMPKLPKRDRKPRKEKPEPPVRKLRKPEEFRIADRDGTTRTVTGEIAFSIGGYDFSIHHNSRSWVVSDVAIGAAISYSQRYKDAVKLARELIEKHFDKYVDQVNKRLGVANEQDIR